MKMLPISETTAPQFTVTKTVKNEPILLSTPHMTGNEMKYINEAFETNWVAPVGPNIDRFEAELASYVRVQGGTALSSGTAAIHVALRLLGVGEGDVVFCSSLTFVASANPILYCGAQPVFIDSEEETWNMSPVALRKAFADAVKTGRLPKAVIVVNLYGQSAQMDELLAICEEYEVPIVEDAAESLGSKYKGKFSGTLGKFGVYSFNGNKIITASGGGMLVSNDIRALKKGRFLASQAKDPAPFYKHSEVGYNYRMSNVLAGIGRAQLEAIEDRVTARREIYHRYEQELGSVPAISFQPEPEGTYSNRWLTVMLIDPELTDLSPHRIKRALDGLKIETRYIWKPLHQQALFEENDFYSHSEGIPVSEQLFRNGLCLPSGSNLTWQEQTKVIEAIKNLFG